MLYTIMPMEVVFGPPPGESQPEVLSVVASVGGGVRALVQPLPDGRARLERLLSTDPADYLRSDLIPGTIVPRIDSGTPR